MFVLFGPAGVGDTFGVDLTGAAEGEELVVDWIVGFTIVFCVFSIGCASFFVGQGEKTEFLGFVDG